MRPLLFKSCLSLATLASVLAQQQHFVTQHASLQADKIAFTPKVKKFIEDLRVGSNSTGIFVSVTHPDGNVELESFGNRTEDGDEITPDTLFVIGSTSKAFTAASVGILIDDFAHGRNVTPLPVGLEAIDWHTKLKDVLPIDWKLQDPWASEKASIRDILSHVTGLSRHDLQYQQGDSAQDVVRRLRYLRPSWELREQWHYNNQMYIVASHIISLYSGQSYPDFVNERIFKPLGMSASTFRQSAARDTGNLTQFFSSNGRRIPFWYPESSADLNAGPGEVISSARDLTKWVGMLLNEGVDPITNKTVIPKSAFEQITSGVSLVTSKSPKPGTSFEAYGHGWARFSLHGHEVVIHNGGLPGASTQVALLPDDGIAIVILCNTSNKDVETTKIFLRILEELLAIPGSQLPTSSIKTLDLVPASAEPDSEYGSGSSALEMQSPITAEEETLPIEAYAGVYYDPAYYNITLCAPSTPNPSSICRQTLEDFSHFDDTSTSNETLYVALSGFWTHRARLRRSSNLNFKNHFKLEPTYLFPEGYGRDKTPFELGEFGGFDSDVWFLVNEGGGGRGEVVGFALDSPDVKRKLSARPIVERRGSGLKERADVWFDKIE